MYFCDQIKLLMLLKTHLVIACHLVKTDSQLQVAV